MEYLTGLTWPEARALAGLGFRVRRWPWLDRWLFRSRYIWWIVPESGIARPVEASDFTLVEFNAKDWTNIWPNQHVCLLEPVPEPEPQPDPGGPIVQHHTFSFTISTGLPQNGAGRGRVYGEKVIENPFLTACLVRIVGTVDDDLALNGRSISGPTGPHDVDVTISLAAGESFRLGAADWNLGGVSYNLTLTFTP